MRKMNECGSATILVLLFIVLLAAAGTGYWVRWGHRDTTTSPASGSSSSSSSGSVAAVACRDLTLSKGSSDGTAGTIYWHAVLTNNGSYACQLTGYPAAFMIDGLGTSVGAASNALYASATVTLSAHGGKAHVIIGLPEAANFAPATTTCTVAASSTLRLYLPGVSIPVNGAFNESGCQGFTVTTLQAGA